MSALPIVKVLRIDVAAAPTVAVSALESANTDARTTITLALACPPNSTVSRREPAEAPLPALEAARVAVRDAAREADCQTLRLGGPPGRRSGGPTGERGRPDSSFWFGITSPRPAEDPILRRSHGSSMSLAASLDESSYGASRCPPAWPTHVRRARVPRTGREAQRSERSRGTRCRGERLERDRAWPRVV